MLAVNATATGKSLSGPSVHADATGPIDICVNWLPLFKEVNPISTPTPALAEAASKYSTSPVISKPTEYPRPLKLLTFNGGVPKTFKDGPTHACKSTKAVGSRVKA